QSVEAGGPYIISVTPTGIVEPPLESVQVVFDRPIDTSTFTAEDVVITGPSGPIAVTDINPSTDHTTFTITFAPQLLAGTYTLCIGPHIQDTSGVEMDQNRDGIPGGPDDKVLQDLMILGPQAPLGDSQCNEDGTVTVTVTFNRIMNASTFTTVRLDSCG